MASVTTLVEQMLAFQSSPKEVLETPRLVKILRNAIISKKEALADRIKAIDNAIIKAKNPSQIKALREERRQVSHEISLVEQYERHE